MKKPLEQQIREARKQAFKFVEGNKPCDKIKKINAKNNLLLLLEKQVRELKKELKNYRQALDYFGNLSAIKSFMKEKGIK